MRERVEPVQGADVEQAARLADEYAELGARDLLHAAVMRRLGVRRLVSDDAGFDRLSELERLDPAGVETWRDEL
jgi:predicted nucleic acid-binding protein